MGDFSKEIRAYALRNAIEFGKADAGRILPKLFQHGLKKEKFKDVLPEIKKIVDEVNKLSEEERKNEFEKLSGHVKEREIKEKELAELENSGEGMVFRLAPFPSGDLHIGNAKTYLLNALYAEKYNGKIILVMDDTIGSEEKQSDKAAYKLIQNSLKWLKVKYDKKVIYKSDRLKIYYDYAERLIEKEKAYICNCAQADFKKLKDSEKECPHRKNSVEENLSAWKKMFDKKVSGFVLRLKTNMSHPNPAFRDRVLFRISEREHPRVGKKYRVWPTLEMTWAVDDHLLGITHIIRGNDLRIETDMEKFIWNIFEWKHPETIHTGLVKIEGVGAKISKSKAQKEVKSGEFLGWDDPRTWSIHSLKRRGIRSEAIREFVKDIGLNRQDIAVPIESLYAINRRMIDSESDRYSFVENPVKLQIAKKPKMKEIKILVHPEKKETRKVKVDEIFVSKEDLKNNKGKEIRLIHLYNVKLNNKNAEFTSEENKNIQKINWVSNGVKTKLLMSDGKWISGIADSGVKNLKKDSVIQFERFGFVRFDGKKKDVYEFWFGHR